MRDQGKWGTCWAHAMYASLESYLLKLGKTLDTSSLGELAGLDDLVGLMDSAGASNLLLSRESVVLNVGESQRLSASFDSANVRDTAVVWSSSDETVATVDTNGLVTALVEGEAFIMAESADGALQAVCQVTVRTGEAESGVTLAAHELTKPAGCFFLLGCTIAQSAEEQTLSWSSSAPDIVAVNAGGVMLAQKAGSATVTVELADGSMDAALITVYEDESFRQLRTPAGLTLLEASAFEDTAFTHVFVSGLVSSIGNRAFAGCRALEYVYIPAAVTSIGEDVFLNSGNVVIGCEPDSAAYSYALSHGLDVYMPA